MSGPAATGFMTADGLRLAARWHLPPPPAGARAGAGARAVVVVHGFCASQEAPEVAALVAHLVGAGHPVLSFDLRGHGRSEGECTLGWRERLDVDAAVAAARDHHDVVVVVGASMGGIAVLDHLAVGAAAPAAAEADAAVTVATPANWGMPRSLAGLMAVVVTQTAPGRSLVARRTGTRIAVRPPRGAPPVERIRRVRRPVAVVHGLDDRFIAPAAAHALYAAAPGPRHLSLVPGMGHGFTRSAGPAVASAVAWALAAVSPSPEPGP